MSNAACLPPPRDDECRDCEVMPSRHCPCNGPRDGVVPWHAGEPLWREPQDKPVDPGADWGGGKGWGHPAD